MCLVNPAKVFGIVPRIQAVRFCVAIFSLSLSFTLVARGQTHADSSHASLVKDYGKLPLSFEANQGQTDPQVKYLSRGNGYSLFLTDSAAVLTLTKGGAVKGSAVNAESVRMELESASKGLTVTGADKLGSTTNYFIGKDPAKWHSGVPTYGKVSYSSVYPGVDLIYYGSQRQLEYDFIVAPGAETKPIQVHFAGATHLKLDSNGNLVVLTRHGQVLFNKPVVYQDEAGQRRTIKGGFKLLKNNTISFLVGSYNRTIPLVIDPVLAYSTYLGGGGAPSDSGGQGAAITVDSAGNAYVAGSTSVADFPTTAGVLQPSINSTDITGNTVYSFVSKLDPTGSRLIYSTYLGGNGGYYQRGDSISGIAVDSDGDAYVAGRAFSTNFPITSGAFQTTNNGAQNVSSNCFTTKLNSTGTALLYSTYLGGNGYGDACSQVVVDAAGSAYVTGSANSQNFPTTSGALLTNTKINAQYYPKAFVAKFDPSGSYLAYSTLLGGSSDEIGTAITLDSQGNAYVVGQTTSTDFPFTSGAYQTINYSYVARSQATGFVAKLNSTGSGLVYATYLGGTGGYNSERSGVLGGSENPTGIAVDAQGDAYVAGLTASQDFPLLNALQSTNKTYASNSVYSYSTGFVTKLNPAGSGLVFSTYLGSSAGEIGFPATISNFSLASRGSGNMTLDASGNVYLTGTTYGFDYPVTSDAFQMTNQTESSHSGFSNRVFSSNAFITELSAAGSMVYSTYLGGSGPVNSYSPGDYGSSIALDSSGNAYVTGIAASYDFPTTSGAFLTSKTTQYNAFVAKVDLKAAQTSTLTTLVSDGNPQTATVKVTVTAFVRATSGGAVPTGTVAFSVDGGAGTPVALDSTGHAALNLGTLSDGSHVVTASYSGDGSHMASSDTLTEVIAGTPTKVTVFSGSNQTGTQQAFLPNPVVVLVTDTNNNPVPNVQVSFGGSNLVYYDIGTQNYSYTNYMGLVSVGVVPTTTGSLTGTAKVTGVNTPAFFSVNGLPTRASSPIFSVVGGRYASTQTVKLTDLTTGALIYYTTDGTTPTTSSTPYTIPIIVSNSETIQAVAIAPNANYSNSVVVSASYAIGALQFIAIPPCRVADTRGPAGSFGAPELGALASREFDLPQGPCGIPSTAVAYSVNVTVVPDKILQYLTLWPSGQAQPNVSTLNSYDGRIKANAAIVPAGTNGGVNVFTSDASNVILDVDGYFVLADTTSALAFYPLAPCRVADTRNPAGALGGPFLAAQSSRSFPVQSSACNIPATAQAYSLNFTTIPHKALGYLTTWPTGQPQPYVSTLNAPTGAVTANAAIVPAGTSGAVSLFVSDDADVILDINGYFAPPATGGLSLYTVTPCRALDTRNLAGLFNGVLPVPFQTSSCALPAAAQAYVVNATVVPPATLSYITLWPDGENQPYVSTLNADDAAITSNLAIIPTANGKIDAFSSNPTQLILDISSYFAP